MYLQDQERFEDLLTEGISSFCLQIIKYHKEQREAVLIFQI
jgi:hypothetical protein